MGVRNVYPRCFCRKKSFSKFSYFLTSRHFFWRLDVFLFVLLKFLKRNVKNNFLHFMTSRRFFWRLDAFCDVSMLFLIRTDIQHFLMSRCYFWRLDAFYDVSTLFMTSRRFLWRLDAFYDVSMLFPYFVYIINYSCFLWFLAKIIANLSLGKSFVSEKGVRNVMEMLPFPFPKCVENISKMCRKHF